MVHYTLCKDDSINLFDSNCFNPCLCLLAVSGGLVQRDVEGKDEQWPSKSRLVQWEIFGILK